jgi:translation initiation factor 2B subunit (eIF-2B alpha/beta/delta family)
MQLQKQLMLIAFLLTVFSPSMMAMDVTNSATQTRSFNNLTSWFTLPQFAKGNPIKQDVHEYVVSRFGNKTFNLCVLTALTQSINDTLLRSSTTRMAVPQFFAISHQDLSAYLNDKIGLDNLWKQFQTQQGNNTKELDMSATLTLNEIRTKIAETFSYKTEIPDAFKQQIRDFVLQDPESLLMVRSSGDEDRTDIANAGGNESVPSVPANAIAIWQAMGVVVQSYFSEKSLRQRLLAGDTITTRFFIPVLIQRMVGEKTLTAKNPTNPLDIPISGVMFTQESMGNTPNVVEIQTAYGHNTGVVNSLVAVDTFYSGPSGVIHPIIRKKTDRLASFKTKTGITLNRINNPIALQSKPTLPTSLVNDLGNIARTIGITYNHPMDIEFVVKRDTANATIYLVQARPLIERKFAQAPNYLSDAFVASLSPQQLAKGQAIGVAGGFIRTITSADELIMRDELPQALNEYHDNPEREKIRAVIVTKMAPTTSHEATQFKGYALPVLVVSPESKAHVEQLLSKGSILIDTQRALIVSPEAQTPTIDQGWYAHPIAECTSIISHYMLPEGSEFRTRYASYIQQLSTKKKDDLTQTHRQLLDLIKKSPDKAVVTDALARIINRIAQQISSKGNNSPENDYLQLFLRAGGEQEQTLLDETQRIIAHAIVCAAEILYTMDTLQTITPANRISYLYPIKFLEATILQQANPEIVDSYSYVLLRKMLKEDREAINTIAPALPANAQEVEQTVGLKNLEYILQLEKMNVLALDDTIKSRWQQFIQQLTASANSAPVAKFASIISQLNDLNVLDLWINTSFMNDATKEQNAITLCNNAIAEFEQNKDIIATSSQKKSILAAWNNKIESWGDP